MLAIRARAVGLRLSDCAPRLIRNESLASIRDSAQACSSSTIPNILETRASPREAHAPFNHMVYCNQLSSLLAHLRCLSYILSLQQHAVLHLAAFSAFGRHQLPVRPLGPSARVSSFILPASCSPVKLSSCGSGSRNHRSYFGVLAAAGCSAIVQTFRPCIAPRFGR